MIIPAWPISAATPQLTAPSKPEIPNFPVCSHHLDLHPQLTAQVIGLANPSSPSSAFSDALTSLGQAYHCIHWGKELRIQGEGRACASL